MEFRLSAEQELFKRMVREYCDEYAVGVGGHAEYLEKIGVETLERIRAVPPFGYAPGLIRG